MLMGSMGMGRKCRLVHLALFESVSVEHSQGLTWVASAMQGWRVSMEDAHIALPGSLSFFKFQNFKHKYYKKRHMRHVSIFQYYEIYESPRILEGELLKMPMPSATKSRGSVKS
jgi:hypothetical protein